MHFRHLLGIVDDLHGGVVDGVLGQRADVQAHAGPLGLDPDAVVRLVGENRDAHHGHAVVDALVDAVQAAVGDESPNVGVSCGQTGDQRSTHRK